MAERRMFAKTVIDSDAFIEMPLSAQALYFHLAMRADDDGFVNSPNRIRKDVGAAEDDMKLLVLKRFVIAFESGVIVIKHWKIHNYIQSDRYKPTVYTKEMALLTVCENKAYTDCIHDVSKLDTQDRLELDKSKDRGRAVQSKDKTTTTTTTVCISSASAREETAPPSLLDDTKEQSRKNAKRLRKDAEKAAAETKKYPAFVRTYEKIAAKYEWGNDTFTICAPKAVADVIYDGMFLSHCVGNAYGTVPGWIRYLDRIQSGESFLLFLRHTDKQDEPYYILEVEPGGAVRQKRTAGDRQDKRDIDDIKAFIAKWQAAIQERLTEKDRQAAEKSRELREEGYAELRRNKIEVRNGYLRGALLADVLEADLLEVGFADNETKKKAAKAKERKAV